METQKTEMEKDLQVQLLQEMADHPAWPLYQAHLEALCRRKEVEKAAALRSNNAFTAAQKQFEIDGINFAMKSLNQLINSLTQNEPA